MLADRRVGVDEDHALLLQVLAQAVIDDLRLVLGADAGQELALGLGNAQLVEGVLDVGRDVVPALALAVGRPHVVVDVVEVELGEVAAPGRRRLLPEDLQGLEAEVAHPLRLVLHLRDLADDLARQSLAALERVVLFRVVEPVLVVVLDARNLEVQIGRHGGWSFLECCGAGL